MHNNNVPDLPNIILHLKCVTSDLNTANNESIIGSSEISAIKHENEIMCYNDQTVCGSEVCNYTDSSSTDSVDDSDSPIRTMGDYEPDNNNNKTNNTHTLYDPSTFANCCLATSTCESSSSSQLFTEWKDKHKQNYQHDDSGGSDNNATMKDIWKKISQLKISYNKMIHFKSLGHIVLRVFGARAILTHLQFTFPSRWLKTHAMFTGVFVIRSVPSHFL